MPRPQPRAAVLVTGATGYRIQRSLSCRAPGLGLVERLALLVDGLLGRDFLDQAHVGEHRQRRIDHARARRIFAAGQFLDRADQIITVARFVGDQLEQHEPQFARAEHPSPTARAQPAAAAAKAAVAGLVLSAAALAALQA